MRFRRVGAEVLDGPSSAGRAGGSDWNPRSTHGRNRRTMVAFAKAWMQGDVTRLAALSAPDITCRWTGFGREPATANGFAELRRLGRDFEHRHGSAARYTVVEAMGGEKHGAILFEPEGLGSDIDHVARVAVYRIEDGRVVAISVYADTVS